jgi:hypothetical protein
MTYNSKLSKMKKLITSIVILMTTVQGFAQNKPDTNQPGVTVPLAPEHINEIMFRILFMSFLIFMLTTLVKYFLDYRLKNKLIDKGMAEQLSTYLLSKNDQEKQNEVIKLAILFCGLGMGLAITYLNGSINILSLAIMAFSLGLSYLAYFFYLRRISR